ncbi:MAG: outer membrane protein assembly factor BamE [Candidatus Accumulibacter sp.]|nr:outer membrane protein assembly factor BamE [Accumulibacter sp.]
MSQWFARGTQSGGIGDHRIISLFRGVFEKRDSIPYPEPRENGRVVLLGNLPSSGGKMNRHSFFIMAAAAALVMTGCAGTNFTRPTGDDLVLGKSSLSDVVKKMGDPRQTGELMKNDQMLKVAKYAYAAAGGESAYPGVTPARALVFTFFRDTLASHEFVSSFKQDSTDFDSQKISSIVKGKSTRQDVTALFGKPSGEAIYPVIKGSGDRAFIYTYTQVKGGIFTLKIFSKTLIVSFGNDGVVSDVEYTASGDQ